MRYFEKSCVIISQTMTDKQKIPYIAIYIYIYHILLLNWKSYVGFLLTYLHLTSIDSKGKDQVKVVHVSTENGQHSWIFAKCFLNL